MFRASNISKKLFRASSWIFFLF